MRILRKREALERLGIRKTAFHDLFVTTGKLRPVNIGTRAVGYLEDEVDALIEDMRRERDRKPRTVERRRRHATEHEARDEKTGPVTGAGEIVNKQQQISEAICTPSLPQDQVAIKRLIFELRLEAKAGAAGIHQLRALLKVVAAPPRVSLHRCTRSQGAAMRSPAFDNWIEQARAVRIEDELARRGIKLKGHDRALRPVPSLRR